MIEFIVTHPSWLYTGGLAVLILGYTLSRSAVARLSYKAGSPRRASELLPGRSFPLSLAKLLLSLVAYTLLVRALAEPLPQHLPSKTATSPSTRIVFLVDVSSSMLASDVLPDRLTQAKRFISESTRALTNEEVGIVVFAATPQLYVPLTSDYEAVRTASLAITPDLVLQQGTSIPKALALASLLFTSPSKKGQIICLLSDGESHTSGSKILADSLSNAGFTLFTIGIGTFQGGTIPLQTESTGTVLVKKDKRGTPIVSSLQEATLKEIAQNKPSRYIKLDNFTHSSLLFTQEINKLTGEKAATPRANDAHFQRWLIAGLALLLVELLLPYSKLLRIK